MSSGAKVCRSAADSGKNAGKNPIFPAFSLDLVEKIH